MIIMLDSTYINIDLWVILAAFKALYSFSLTFNKVYVFFSRIRYIIYISYTHIKRVI